MSEQDARFISRVLRERNIHAPLRAGVSRDMIESLEYRDAFDFILRHHTKYGEVPTGTTVKVEFPNLRLIKVEDSLEYVTDALFSARRKTLMVNMITDTISVVERKGTPEEIAAVASKALEQMHSLLPTVNDYDLTNDPDERLAEYKALAVAPNGLLGLPTGFATIDTATGGLQKGQLVTIIASPKTGKSQLALRIAANIHANGASPLFQSFEMSNAEQKKRYDAMNAEIDHAGLQRGSLVKKHWNQLEASLQGLKGTPQFVLSDSTVGITVSAVTAKAMEYSPDALFIDGAYLMIDEQTGESGTPQSLTNITRSLKRVAQRLDIPVIITTQTLLWKMKKNRINQGSIGYSSSFLQDSDVVLALERTEDEDEMVRILKIVASRNSGPAEVPLLWDWGAGRFEEPTGASSISFGNP